MQSFRALGQSGDVRLEVNRWVFRCFLKLFRVLQCRESEGKLFHISVAEYENACLPKLVVLAMEELKSSGSKGGLWDKMSI